MDKPKILIVDDDQVIRDFLRTYLTWHIDCDISEVSNSQEVFEIFKKGTFDLIFLDIKMPGISGIEVLKKTRLTHPQTDILIVSGWDSNMVASEVLKEGAIDYIPKPFNLNVLQAKVSDILKRKNKYIPKKKKIQNKRID